jgi:DNA-binding SARP family transcriptional activator
VLRREQLHILALDALHRLTEQALDQADNTQAQRYARRQLALEPWREHAHRQLMRALARGGDRSAALAQYEACRRILAAELGALYCL